MQIENNTILVTGGASGIGRGLAEAFHRCGNTVIIAGRRRALLDQVTDANPGMAAIELDVSDADSIRAAASHLVATYPDLNVLVNNAGIMPFDDAAGAMDDAVVQRIVATNLLGPIRMTSALIGHLRSRPRATIINNTSVLAFLPLASAAVYSATKAALHSYTLSQRVLLRGTGVSVREIAPPWVDTDLVRKSGDPRAMPLDAYIAETMAGLATDVPEVVVEAARTARANPGPGEHAVVEAFNDALAADPIPV